MVGWNDQKGSKKTLGRVESDRVEAGELKCGARFSQLSLDSDRHTSTGAMLKTVLFLCGWCTAGISESGLLPKKCPLPNEVANSCTFHQLQLYRHKS